MISSIFWSDPTFFSFIAKKTRISFEHCFRSHLFVRSSVFVTVRAWTLSVYFSVSELMDMCEY